MYVALGLRRNSHYVRRSPGWHSGADGPRRCGYGRREQGGRFLPQRRLYGVGVQVRVGRVLFRVQVYYCR